MPPRSHRPNYPRMHATKPSNLGEATMLPKSMWQAPESKHPCDGSREASGDVSDEMRTKFSDLALSIFIRSTPKDPVHGLRANSGDFF